MLFRSALINENSQAAKNGIIEAALKKVIEPMLFGETEEKAALITDYGKDVIQLEQRMAELAAADAARTKKHHERHATAPEH